MGAQGSNGKGDRHGMWFAEDDKLSPHRHSVCHRELFCEYHTRRRQIAHAEDDEFHPAERRLHGVVVGQYMDDLAHVALRLLALCDGFAPHCHR
jgi:hypothetical protein